MSICIRGGRVVDPASRVDAVLNVLIENGRIARVSADPMCADCEIDAAGKIVAPGFIDMHMHEDPVDARGRIACSIFNCMLRMGVTTVMGGNCGINVCDPLEYLDLADRDGVPVNVAMLAGHTWFREAAGASDKYAAATDGQIDAMCAGIRRALSGGCMGMSLGVRYVPGTTGQELERAAACCRESGAMIAAHVRDDADFIFGAIDEVARLGAANGVPVQISHIGSMGGFGQMEAVLRQIDEYRMNGLDIAADCYPYCAFSTEVGATTYDDGWLERYRCGYDALEFCEGPFRGCRANAETFARMRREFPACITVCHVMKPQEIARAYAHPNVIVASDGIMDDGQGHPRAAGTFPRFLAEYVRTGQVDLYTAIGRMTALPAQRMGLARKGRLSAGADADVVIFDPQRIRDRATFAEPTLPPEGVEWVLVGGTIAARNGEILSDRCGRSVRRVR